MSLAEVGNARGWRRNWQRSRSEGKRLVLVVAAHDGWSHADGDAGDGQRRQSSGFDGRGQLARARAREDKDAVGDQGRIVERGQEARGCGKEGCEGREPSDPTDRQMKY